MLFEPLLSSSLASFVRMDAGVDIGYALSRHAVDELASPLRLKIRADAQAVPPGEQFGQPHELRVEKRLAPSYVDHPRLVRSVESICPLFGAGDLGCRPGQLFWRKTAIVTTEIAPGK